MTVIGENMQKSYDLTEIEMLLTILERMRVSYFKQGDLEIQLSLMPDAMSSYQLPQDHLEKKSMDELQKDMNDLGL